MQMRFDGRVVLVTGAAKGIGEAAARVFAALGAQVALFDIDPQVNAVARQIEATGARSRGYMCDVRSGDEVSRSTEQVATDFGCIDVLIANAGIQDYGDVVSTSEEAWDKVLATNLKGCFLSSKFAIPHMLKQGHGSIVVVGSVQSVGAAAHSAAYVAAKHGVVGLTRSMALDYAQQGIRVNCVCPGSIDTPMLRWAASLSAHPEAVMERSAQMHAMGRIGTAEEVANAIAFLASDAASFITGAVLLVDGGMMVPTGGMPFQSAR